MSHNIKTCAQLNIVDVYILILYSALLKEKQTNIELMHPRLSVATSLKKMLQIMQLVYNNRAQQSSHSNIIKLIYCKQESFPRQLSKGFDLVIVARKSNRRLRCSVADLGQNFIGLISERDLKAARVY
jgi:hypothetical protein